MADALLDSQIASGELIAKVWRNTTKLGADNLTIEVLQNRLALLETYWKEYVSRHQALFAHRKPLKESEYFTADLFSDVEAIYIDTRVKLMTKLSEKIGAIQDTLSTDVNVASNTTYRVTSTASSLPKLKLPRFSGKQEEWESFKEIFCSMVKNDPSLTPVLKLQHLLSCLDGEAARRVANLQVVGANFDVAWKILETRYDNQRLRLAVQLNRLIGMKPAASKSVSEINRLLDTTNECKRALESLGRPTSTWDDWFVQLIVYNLDSSTREDWEKSLEGVQTFPTFDTLAKFLENRTKSMDTARCSESNHQQRQQIKIGNSPSTHKPNFNSVKNISAHLSSSPSKTRPSAPNHGCLFCKGDHFIGYCATLLQKDPVARRAAVERLKLCRNCLRAGHFSAACPSTHRCKDCKKDHHSILHIKIAEPSRTADNLAQSLKPVESKAGSSVTTQGYTTMVGNTTLLATAQVIVCSPKGECLQIRALIDPAAEGSFITEKVVQLLSLSKSPLHTTVSGVGAAVHTTSSFCTSVVLKSKLYADFSINFSAAVLPRLTQLLPRTAVNGDCWTHIKGLRMADPDFNTPAAVDCILGGDLFPAIVLKGIKKGPRDMPIAQNTKFGWILTGPTRGRSTQISAFSTTLMTTTAPSTSDTLRHFWEIEDIPSTPPLTPDEEACDLLFERTHLRDKDGRYVVRLPFREEPYLPGSRAPALHRLLSMERKLSKDIDLRSNYVKFMDEYEHLQHMAPVPESDDSNCGYFLPHHAVVKQDGSRKLRVVFDASQATSTGRSLNSFLYPGPKLQLDISTVLTRWRMFPYVLVADIVKMFRQILVHEDDTKWQQILWRATPESTMKTYRLSTVTYGTTCAPYLANKVLQQLAADEEHHYPLGAQILREHIYVDDALAGGYSLEEACTARRQLQQILASAGMQLDKWSANNPHVLPESCSSKQDSYVSFDENEVVSTLGLRWAPHPDCFHFRVDRREDRSVVTKRTILQEVARLYDPLGWLAPVIVRAKVLLQLLWITGKDWDVPVDDSTRQQWKDFCDELPVLEKQQIPRWFGANRTSQCQLHGFSDASEKAYAAAVYLVVCDENSGQHSTLVAAKTKVAPIKTISIPRLELCGALLLAKLLAKIQEDLGRHYSVTYCWTDSQVVLAWLQGRPGSWHTFVANRVSKILTLLPNVSWRHVRSTANPADLATRGMTPSQLLNSNLWWFGPVSLFFEADESNTSNEYSTTLEKKTVSSAFHVASANSIEVVISRFSSIKLMLKVLSFVYRWKPSMSTAGRRTGSISTAELKQTRQCVVRQVQQHHFAKTIERIQQGQPLRKDDPLRRLSPFLDENGLLRVGGRLQFSFLSDDEKHPLLISRASHLAVLLIRDAHEATLHGGPQLMQSHLLRNYWIPQVRNKIRLCCRECVRCLRFNGKKEDQLMAPLPSARVTPARPFQVTGVDYAGPFLIRTSKGRGQHACKGYVAIFTCFATRAVHIEVVSDYSAKTFLLAFRRFVARRGLCHTIVSDNGTTFQGADSELRRAFQETSEFSQEVADAIRNDGVEWSFIPPRAPHFGGLWEAAVKAFKHHLKRVVGDAKLTFEEFSTLAASIEACLNSRPLSPLSSDPSDVAALTPGHFLIGTALTAPPEPFHSDSYVTGIPRWQVTTQMRNHFWRRWRKEVLHHLQQRSKWTEQKASINIGDLVLITDDLQPPLKWSLGRVKDLHPGPDGLVRVVTLRTATTTLQRPLTKLILLPVNNEAASYFALFQQQFQSAD